MKKDSSRLRKSLRLEERGGDLVVMVVALPRTRNEITGKKDRTLESTCNLKVICVTSSVYRQF